MSTLLPTPPDPRVAETTPGQVLAAVAAGQCQVYARAQLRKPATAFGRRDYYKVSLLTGRSRYHYATRGVLIDRSALVLSNPLVPYAWEALSPEQGGYGCVFAEEFLLAPGRAASLQESPLFRLGSDPVYFLSEAEYADFEYLFGKMLRELHSGYRYQQEVLRHYLSLVLHETQKLAPHTTYYQPPNAASRIAALFQQLLGRQFPLASPTRGLQLRTPGDFARCLAVHVNHLNRAVRAQTGKTTTAHIAERLIAEAKALLLHTSWSTADIAYGLGFAYPTYFNNFFKKQTGTSPSALRAGLGPRPPKE